MCTAEDLEYRRFLAAHLADPQFVGIVDERIEAALHLAVRAVRAETESKRAYFSGVGARLIEDWAIEAQERLVATGKLKG